MKKLPIHIIYGSFTPNAKSLIKLYYAPKCWEECQVNVSIYFTQSLDTGELPRDWSLSNVAPIFKKGNRGLAENYRPVSLTCITCKLFEHFVCRHTLDHVEDHQILTNLQHGFRSGRSCETQLITTTHDLLSSFNSKSQIDVAILDFSKAFDTVPMQVYSGS